MIEAPDGSYYAAPIWNDYRVSLTTGNLLTIEAKKSYVAEPLRPYVKHLKYVLEAGNVAADGLPVKTMGYGGAVARPWDGFKGTVWVQPLDAKDPEQNAANIKACVESAKKFGYRVSLQGHKYMGVE